MQISHNKRTVNLSAILCTLGHDYIITNTITPYIKEYKCCNCGREVTDNLQGNLELLTEKSRIVNECMRSFFRKKTKHIKISV